MCGPSGVGKSTWIEKNHKKDTAVVSRDEIRFSIVKEDEPYFSREKQVYAEYVSIIASCLNHGTDTYADSTNLTKKARKALINNIMEELDNPDDLKVVAIDFYNKNMYEQCIINNRKRSGRRRVPDEAIQKHCSIYERPQLGEKKIVRVIRIEDGDEE